MSNKKQHSVLNELARLLVEAQRVQKLSAVQMAERIGCHRSLLYRWMNGDCVPYKTSHLHGIAQVCGRDIESILKLVFGAERGSIAGKGWDEISRSLLQIQKPDDLTRTFSILSKIFQAEQVELFLANPVPIACLWCVGIYPLDPSRIGTPIRINYAAESRLESVEDVIARVYVTCHSEEVLDVRTLGHIGSSSIWVAAYPLVYKEQGMGCLVLKSSVRAALTLAETDLIKEVCGCLAEIITRHHWVFERVGAEYAFKRLLDIYKEIRGEDSFPIGWDSYLSTLISYTTELGTLLLSVSRRLRLAHFHFHDVSIQQIDKQTGTMLAIGTQRGKVLLPPALFNAVTGVPCWESFMTGKSVYRPDLRKEDPYNEKDTISSRPAQAILDISFNWGKYHGTLGINSLEPKPWKESEIKALEDLVQRFRS